MGIIVVDNALKSQAFRLKGRLYTLTVLSILESDASLLAQQIAKVVSRAPRMFQNTPVVLDCTAVNGDELDLQALCQCVRKHGLAPIAIQGGNSRLNTLAQSQGLALLKASSRHDKPLRQQDGATRSSVIEPRKTKLLTTPVRSGQQIVSQGDLIVVASVSHGAELLADGHIHVYGSLRGRALAGIDGNKQARIFCRSLEAELVSIAGFYRLSDAIESFSGSCQIFLQDDHIQIERI